MSLSSVMSKGFCQVAEMSQGNVLPTTMRATYDNWCFASGVRHESTIRATVSSGHVVQHSDLEEERGKESEKGSQPISPETHAQRRTSRPLDADNRSSDQLQTERCSLTA